MVKDRFSGTVWGVWSSMVNWSELYGHVFFERTLSQSTFYIFSHNFHIFTSFIMKLQGQVRNGYPHTYAKFPTFAGHFGNVTLIFSFSFLNFPLYEKYEFLSIFNNVNYLQNHISKMEPFGMFTGQVSDDFYSQIIELKQWYHGIVVIKAYN